MSDFKNLQIGDNDLIGNKFNGHDLHFYLRENHIDSSHLVWKKESDDINTYLIAGEKIDREQIRQNTLDIQKEYSLNSVLNPISYDILYNKLYLEADVIHFHLIHNNIFDIQLLPLMSRLKPIIWTVHDPWPTSGHCIESFDCQKWQTGCGDCHNLDIPFPLEKDNTALNYELKKLAILNSKLDIIVASRYMKERLSSSDMFKNAKIHVVPFGINHEIFKSVDKKSVRLKLGVPEDAFVISFRGDNNYKKGLDYIAYTIDKIKTNKKIYFLVFGGEYGNKNKKYNFLEYGWIKDDLLMADIYNASDLFLMPSIIESFGMMAIEAMSCGVMPIVLEGTALSDVINASECGVAIKRNKNAYARAVQYYIDHNDKRNEREKKCLEFARKKYNKDVYVNKIIALYRDVVKKHQMTKNDKFLLNQLKKYMVIEPKNQLSTNLKKSMDDDVLRNIHFSTFILIKIKQAWSLFLKRSK